MLSCVQYKTQFRQNMQKTILLTGATDGIGFVTAKQLTGDGHRVLVHGRDAGKISTTAEQLSFLAGGSVDTFQADLANFKEIQALCNAVKTRAPKLDVIINNAGIFKTSSPTTADGLDARFVVNAIAPYLLTQSLLPNLAANGRVINLSSAAQAPVDIDALQGNAKLDDMAAYSQSKLAITSWTRSIDNDSGMFASPHPDAVNPEKMKILLEAIDSILHKLV